MAIVGGTFAQGQLATSKATLYTVGVGVVAHVTQIILVNTDASARTVNIYIKMSGGTSRRIIAKDLSLAAGASYWVPISPSALRLSAGDLIEGDASAATVVDYTISGGLE